MLPLLFLGVSDLFFHCYFYLCLLVFDNNWLPLTTGNETPCSNLSLFFKICNLFFIPLYKYNNINIHVTLMADLSHVEFK